ncbi:pentapeptide repeat-containing protein [Sinisalibacter aestuarii]|uniref:Pentapeptide repeat-containing protein n=1 Tax=Sinisalibacter aestuarii TaxID=2949426 RepID=A0ABQ5LX81_9RHOB|nr:pentapeptide repeat-containing protein [Sinisalibacter aestuarii]GKY89573.1 hypothetical protein STA1M1_34420 [Sinisalibacter aestuarii]
MKRAMAILTLALVPTGSHAWDEAALDRLRETKTCESCDLSGADLRWANVYEAELAGADNLVNAVLNGADLSGANLYGANLQGTALRGANLQGAEMSWANLRSADLNGADVTDAKFTGAIFCKTTMPDGSVNDDNC